MTERVWRDEVLERGSAMWGERLVAAVEGRPMATATWPVSDLSLQVASVASAVPEAGSSAILTVCQ